MSRTNTIFYLDYITETYFSPKMHRQSKFLSSYRKHLSSDLKILLLGKYSVFKIVFIFRASSRAQVFGRPFIVLSYYTCYMWCLCDELYTSLKWFQTFKAGVEPTTSRVELPTTLRCATCLARKISFVLHKRNGIFREMNLKLKNFHSWQPSQR